ncbi:MAG TPA: VPLPA-CTERM sorting domain-containing protein [Lacipirellula sp.]
MKAQHILAACVVVAIVSRHATAEEPNETFETSTILAPGVLTVNDELAAGVSGQPDTVLGIKDHFGSYYHVDDDGSPLGNGRASGVGNVPTNSGSIDFSISGYPDETFVGSHGEEGGYRVFVDVYDFFGDPVDSFSETRALTAGAVHDFSFNDFNWIQGFYDVYIDNTVGFTGDVDFFTFSGLTPGAPFTAETFDPQSSQVDTFLGLFDASGTLIDHDDDDGEGDLSRLEGTVPTSGSLNLAVSGFGDGSFAGSHEQSGTYELTVTIGAGLAGDFNGDNQVNAQDLAAWKQGFSAAAAAADADDDGDSDGQDFIVWQQNLGEGVPAAVAALATPEPAGVVLMAAALGGLPLHRVRRST